MSNLTPEQRSLIRQRAVELGFTDDAAFRIGLNAQDVGAGAKTAKELLVVAFTWRTSPKGVEFWLRIYENL